MGKERIYRISAHDVDGQLFNLEFTEKKLLAVQKAINLILNNHGPLAKRCEVEDVTVSMKEAPNGNG